jgi:hypothetical protein
MARRTVGGSGKKEGGNRFDWPIVNASVVNQGQMRKSTDEVVSSMLTGGILNKPVEGKGLSSPSKGTAY